MAGTEFRKLVRISKSLEGEYASSDVSWRRSPFAWIRTQQSRRRGSIGEELVARYLGRKGFAIDPAGDSQADLQVDGHRFEVKFSTLWEAGFYKFQQIRRQRYEGVICLGISPHTVHCWVIPKAVILRYSPPQHAGKRGRDTRWLTVDPRSIPTWMKRYGGNPRLAVRVLRRFVARAR